MGDADAARLAWWQRGVIYQIYPRSYQDGNGDGVGDLRGITGRLDHLAWLGVDAVWLSPIFTSPMEDGGYDVSDYTAVDPIFGTIADFEALVARAHDLGLRVVIDFVPNHTSHAHPWFIASRAARDADLRDWYIWRDPDADGGPPNNWRCVTDDRPGRAWNLDERTGQWYLATFSPVQPDLNWANADVRAAMADVLRYWLDLGVDGFRIDMVGFLAKDQDFRDEDDIPQHDGASYVRYARRHFNRPETVDHLRELRAVVDAYPDRVVIGEMAYEDPIDRLVDYAVRAGIDLPTNFRFITGQFELDSVVDALDTYDRAATEAGVWPNWCLSNHDTPRPTVRGRAAARMALVVLLTVRGTPFVYYGDEIGMGNVDVPPARRDDPWSTAVGGVTRDSFRTPMQWDGGPNAGFCPPDVEPWLPVGDDRDQVNVATERDDPASSLHLVRRLLDLRRRRTALTSGAYRRRQDAADGCLVFQRGDGADALTVAANFAATVRDIPVDATATADPRVLVATGAVELDARAATIRLGAHAAAVIGGPA